MDSWSRNFELLIKSRTPLIWIRTKEEERLYKIIDQSCKKLNIKRFVSWDCVNGIKGLLNENGKFSNNPLGVLNWIKEQTSELPTILLVRDFHKFYDDPSISRTIKELSSSLRETNNNVGNSVVCSFIQLRAPSGLLENLPFSLINPFMPLTQSQVRNLLIFNLLHD